MSQCPQVKIMEMEEENAKLRDLLEESRYPGSINNLTRWHEGHIEPKVGCPYCEAERQRKTAQIEVAFWIDEATRFSQESVNLQADAQKLNATIDTLIQEKALQNGILLREVLEDLCSAGTWFLGGETSVAHAHQRSLWSRAREALEAN